MGKYSDIPDLERFYTEIVNASEECFAPREQTFEKARKWIIPRQSLVLRLPELLGNWREIFPLGAESLPRQLTASLIIEPIDYERFRIKKV